MEIVIKNGAIRIKGKTGILQAILGKDGFEISSLGEDNAKRFGGAGEYEVSGISVIGVTDGEGTAFVYEVDNLRIANLTAISEKLNENKLQQLGDIDVLLLGTHSKSIEIMQQIEPYFVLPIVINGNTDSLDKFLKESGLVVNQMPKFSLKKEEIIEDMPTQIVVLEF